MRFKKKLQSISKDLENCTETRAELLEKSINSRLTLALHNYDKLVADSYNYLVHRGSLRVMNKLCRGKKR